MQRLINDVDRLIPVLISVREANDQRGRQPSNADRANPFAMALPTGISQWLFDCSDFEPSKLTKLILRLLQEHGVLGDMWAMNHNYY